MGHWKNHEFEEICEHVAAADPIIATRFMGLLSFALGEKDKKSLYNSMTSVLS